MPREASIEARACVAAMQAGALLVKLHHGIAGFPDRVLLLPGGKVRLIEFKAPRGRVTALQRYWHYRLADIGHPVAVVASLAEFRKQLTA